MVRGGMDSQGRGGHSGTASNDTPEIHSQVQTAYNSSPILSGSVKGSRHDLLFKLFRPPTSAHKHLSPSGFRRTIRHALTKGTHIGY